MRLRPRGRTQSFCARNFGRSRSSWLRSAPWPRGAAWARRRRGRSAQCNEHGAEGVSCLGVGAETQRFSLKSQHPGRGKTFRLPSVPSCGASNRRPSRRTSMMASMRSQARRSQDRAAETGQAPKYFTPRPRLLLHLRRQRSTSCSDTPVGARLRRPSRVRLVPDGAF